MKRLTFIILFFVSNISLAADCYDHSWTNADGVRIVYYIDRSMSVCESLSDSRDRVAMTYQEYQSLLGGSDNTTVITNEEYDEYQTLKDAQTPYDQIKQTLIELFEFSASDFALFNGICIVAFITGHTLGRVVRIFGKT